MPGRGGFHGPGCAEVRRVLRRAPGQRGLRHHGGAGEGLEGGTGGGHPHPRLPSEDALQGELGAGHAGGGADRGGPARGPGRNRQPVSLYRHAAPVAAAVPALGAGRAGAGDHRRVHEPELSPAGHGRSRVHPVRQRARRLGRHRGGASGQARAPCVGGQDYRADRGDTRPGPHQHLLRPDLRRGHLHPRHPPHPARAGRTGRDAGTLDLRGLRRQRPQPQVTRHASPPQLRHQPPGAGPVRTRREGADPAPTPCAR